MAERPKLNLENLSVEELMQGLEAADPAASNTVELWIKDDGLYPGTSRVQAADLYAKYVEWFDNTKPDGSRLDIKRWGKVMVGRFKRTRTKRGSNYYISHREAHSFEP